MSIKRTQLLTNYEFAKSEIEKLTEINSKLIFQTQNVYIPGFGVLSDIAECGNSHSILNAFNYVKSRFNSDEIANLAKEIGLKIETDDTTFFGYSLDEWLIDFQSAAKLNNNLTMINKFKLAKEKFENNFSADDKFKLDMSEVDMSLFEDNEDDKLTAQVKMI